MLTFIKVKSASDEAGSMRMSGKRIAYKATKSVARRSGTPYWMATAGVRAGFGYQPVPLAAVATLAYNSARASAAGGAPGAMVTRHSGATQGSAGTALGQNRLGARTDAADARPPTDEVDAPVSTNACEPGACSACDASTAASQLSALNVALDGVVSVLDDLSRPAFSPVLESEESRLAILLRMDTELSEVAEMWCEFSQSWRVEMIAGGQRLQEIRARANDELAKSNALVSSLRLADLSSRCENAGAQLTEMIALLESVPK